MTAATTSSVVAVPPTSRVRTPEPVVRSMALFGIEVIDTIDDGIGPCGFYGRCSTEDNQDPETSHGW